MPGGRPTDYEPRYCDMVETFMEDGYSLTAFAGSIGVSRSTINVWMQANPEFSEAVLRAKAKRMMWWEQQGRKIADVGGGPGSATLTIFGLKNADPDEWRDKTETTHNAGTGVEAILAFIAGKAKPLGSE
jgi:hypothetical protein